MPTLRVPSLDELSERKGAITPTNGVVTLFGYGISVTVDRGHLTLQDGVGPNRRYSRFSRVGHRLKRVVVIGSSRHISFEALRWLTDQDVAFTLLERDGKVLAITGPVSPSDVRLRRAQATAHETGIALPIARELIDKKLGGQALLLRKNFPSYAAVEGITNARARLAKAESNAEILSCEACGAQLYWAAWHELPISFPHVDLPRVPEHWRTFGSRMSPLTTSPRLAVNPPNAMLNYLYSILEAEARLALASLGLDPGIGMLHSDLRSRDSLACDVMEPVRPQVDAFLLDWLRRSPLKREWFFEQRDGNCRLMAPFAAKLSESAQIWRRAVAPFAEGIARALWSHRRDGRNRDILSTPLTRSRKRESRGSIVNVLRKLDTVTENVCGICGVSIKRAYKHCLRCPPTIWPNKAQKASEIARDPIAQARRASSQRVQAAALKTWKTSDKADWLDLEFYREQIQPSLAAATVSAIVAALGVSESYATNIRAGRVPHPRHWLTLARLVAVSVDDKPEQASAP